MTTNQRNNCCGFFLSNWKKADISASNTPINESKKKRKKASSKLKSSCQGDKMQMNEQGEIQTDRQTNK